MGASGIETSGEMANPEELSVESPPLDADAVEATVDGTERPEPTSPAEGPEPAADAELIEALSRLDKRLGESQRLLDRQGELAQRLHSENQALREGELRSAQLPLLRDLMRLHDDVGRMRDSAEEEGDLRIVHKSLLDTLARNGVVAFEPEKGDEFDPRNHTVAGVEATSEEGLDRTVAAVVKQGFRWESGEVIRVAEVTAYRLLDPA